MIEPIKKYMKPGIIHFMAYPSTMSGGGDVVGTMRNILMDDYFDAIEVTWIKDEAQRAQAIKMLQQSHITVAYGAQPRLLTTGYNPNDLDEEKRQITLKSLKEGIDDAYD